jgi:hypothetical protein
MFRVSDPNNGGFVSAQPYITWLKEQIGKNRPYNELVRDMLGATGKPWDNGATGYLLRDRGMLLDNLANTFSIFLGTDVACAQCHDHPFSDWTQMQFYQLASFFGSTVTNLNDAQLKNGDPKVRIMAELTALDPEQAKKVEGIVDGIIDANRMEVRDTDENRLRLPMDYKYKDGKGGDPVKPKFITWSKEDRSGDAYRDNKTKKQEKQREAFAMLMRADPKLLEGANKLWVRFFLLSVYATMYVRDHNRPVFHAALGVDPTEYDYKVFAICNQISRQVFPVELDTDTPAFRRQMEKLRIAAARIETGKEQGGIGGFFQRASGMAGAGLAFARMYLQKPKSNALPRSVRLQPAW